MVYFTLYTTNPSLKFKYHDIQQNKTEWVCRKDNIDFGDVHEKDMLILDVCIEKWD